MILDMYSRSTDEFVRSQAALVRQCRRCWADVQLAAPSPVASPVPPAAAEPSNGHGDVKADPPAPAPAPTAPHLTEALFDAHPTEALFAAHPTEALFNAHPTEALLDAHPTEALLSPKRPASPPRPADVAPSPRPGSTAPGEETATQREERLRVEVGDAKDAVLRSTS